MQIPCRNELGFQERLIAHRNFKKSTRTMLLKPNTKLCISPVSSNSTSVCNYFHFQWIYEKIMLYHKLLLPSNARTPYTNPKSCIAKKCYFSRKENSETDRQRPSPPFEGKHKLIFAFCCFLVVDADWRPFLPCVIMVSKSRDVRRRLKEKVSFRNLFHSITEY